MPRISNPQNFKGENLISKEALGLKSDEVLVVSGTTAANKVIAAEFLPEVTVKEKTAEGEVITATKAMGPIINFIGNCGVRQNSDGSLTIRIGDNLNSSNFMTNDGQTNGVNTTTVTNPATSTGKYLDGKTINVASGALSYAIDTTVASGLIHMDNPLSTKFILDYTISGVAKQMEFGPILLSGANGIVSSGTFAVNGAKLTVNNFGLEPKTAQGATGYCGNIAFNIPVSSLASANEIVQLSALTYVNGGEGNFVDKTISGNTKRFYYTNTTTKPGKPAKVWYSVNATGSGVRSGITYFTGGKVSAYVSGLTDMFTPIGVDNNVTFDANNFATDKSVFTYSETAASGVLDLATCYVASPIITATPKNINGNGTALQSANDYASGLIIYKSTPDASIDENTSVNTGRVKADGTDWIPSAALSSDDLQLLNGNIVYPSINFTGFNGKNSDRDYSILGTGNKAYYTRVAYNSGSNAKATLTITGSNLSKLKGIYASIKIGDIDARDALVTTGNGGICDNSDVTNSTSRTIKLSLSGFGEDFANGPDSTVYVKLVIGSKDDNVTISKITLA